MTDLKATPKRYITERRLSLARREILLGAKAAVISAQCGFSDYSAFFRAYKKHFGHSPTVTQQSAFVRVGFDDVLKGHTE